jgi:hypothetical protein
MSVGLYCSDAVIYAGSRIIPSSGETFPTPSITAEITYSTLLEPLSFRHWRLGSRFNVAINRCSVGVPLRDINNNPNTLIIIKIMAVRRASLTLNQLYKSLSIG